MFHEYPYTNFSELNLDWLVCACKQNEGLHLAVVGDTLKLLNKENEVISNVTISYADKALTDVDGRNIQTYIISAGVAGDTIVFTKGDQTISSITIPYAEKAKYDIYNNELTDYVLNIQVVGDKLRITKGDTTVAEITVPFATKASQDEDGNSIKTYACDLTVDGQNIQLRDRAGRVLSAITVPFAVNAGTANNATHAATADTALEADHADDADHADFATLAADADNAIESVVITGDTLVFTTHDGTATTITVPYALKSQKDDIGNTIKTTYVAGVSTNATTGEISFLDALGNVITSLIPQTEVANKDTSNNIIANYIKQVLTDTTSNYVTVVHGTGATDSILINYATHALKDINDQAIHNTYVTYMDIQEDVEDGRYKLFYYNGDSPKAALGSVELVADSAAYDPNGKTLTSYVAKVSVDASDSKKVNIVDGDGNSLNIISASITSTPAGSVSTSISGTAVSLTQGTLPSCTYDSATETITFNAGVFPTVDTITDPVATSSFTGTQSTVDVDFDD